MLQVKWQDCLRSIRPQQAGTLAALFSKAAKGTPHAKQQHGPGAQHPEVPKRSHLELLPMAPPTRDTVTDTVTSIVTGSVPGVACSAGLLAAGTGVNERSRLEHLASGHTVTGSAPEAVCSADLLAVGTGVNERSRLEHLPSGHTVTGSAPEVACSASLRAAGTGVNEYTRLEDTPSGDSASKGADSAGLHTLSRRARAPEGAVSARLHAVRKGDCAGSSSGDRDSAPPGAAHNASANVNTAREGACACRFGEGWDSAQSGAAHNASANTEREGACAGSLGDDWGGADRAHPSAEHGRTCAVNPAVFVNPGAVVNPGALAASGSIPQAPPSEVPGADNAGSAQAAERLRNQRGDAPAWDGQVGAVHGAALHSGGDVPQNTGNVYGVHGGEAPNADLGHRDNVQHGQDVHVQGAVKRRSKVPVKASPQRKQKVTHKGQSTMFKFLR